MVLSKVLDKRRKNGTFAKGHIPANPFKKGNVPWNDGKGHPNIEFICKGCGEKVIVPFRKRQQKFCSKECALFYNANNNPILLENRYKNKDPKDWIYYGRIKEYKHEWYLKHKEELSRKGKENYSKNKKRIEEINKRWKKNNPEKVSFIKQAYKRRKRTAEGNFTFEEWENLKKRCDYICQRCGKKEPEIKLTVDHIIPLDKGGTNYIKNIQPLCGSCNSSKGNRD